MMSDLKGCATKVLCTVNFVFDGQPISKVFNYCTKKKKLFNY